MKFEIPPRSGHRSRRLCRVIVSLAVGSTMILCAGSILGACSSSAKGTSTTITSTSTSRSNASTTTKPVTQHVLVATFADNGGTLTVQKNNRIRVVLAGTSWTQSSSNPAVVAPALKATILPATSGCVPNQGCGSVTVFYRVLKDGNAAILGARSNCQGAAATCKTGPGGFRLMIVAMG
jgi:hypothetical protein